MNKSEIDLNDLKYHIRAINERLDSMTNAYIKEQSLVHDYSRRIYRKSFRSNRTHLKQGSYFSRIPFIDVSLLAKTVTIIVILLLFLLLLFFLGYFAFRSGTPIEQIPQEVPLEATTESWWDYLWMGACVIGIGSVILLYYIYFDTDDISISTERNDSVLPHIPEHLRDQFQKDLESYKINKDYARALESSQDLVDHLPGPSNRSEDNS